MTHLRDIHRAYDRANDYEWMGSGLLVTMIVVGLVLGLFASIIAILFSRQREFRADRRITTFEFVLSATRAGPRFSDSWISDNLAQPQLTACLRGRTVVDVNA